MKRWCLLLLLALAVTPAPGAQPAVPATVECPGALTAPLNRRFAPEGFRDTIRARIEAALATDDLAVLATISLSDAALCEEFDVRQRTLLRWLEENLSVEEQAELPKARTKTTKARQRVNRHKQMERGVPTRPETFREDVLAAILAVDRKDLTVGISIPELAERYQVTGRYIRMWMAEVLDETERTRWSVASRLVGQEKTKKKREKPAPSGLATWLLEHVTRMEDGEEMDWFTIPRMCVMWRTSIPTFRAWIKTVLTEPEQRRLAAMTEKARRSRTAKAKSLPVPEGFGDMLRRRMAEATNAPHLSITSNDLAAEFDVAVLTLRRWMDESLEPEEVTRWREVQFDVVSKRMTEERLAKPPEGFRAKVLARLERVEAGEEGVAFSYAALAAEEGVLTSGLPRRWVREVLDGKELERFIAAVRKRHSQIVSESRTVKMPAGFREQILNDLAIAEAGGDAPITVRDLRLRHDIASYETIIKLLDRAFDDEELARWEKAVDALLRRRQGDRLREDSPGYFVDGLRYDSKSEYATSRALAKYVEGWAPQIDVTFQLPAWGGGRFDFRVGDTILEYHPVILVTGDSRKMVGDLNPDELIQYHAELAQVAPEARTPLRARWRKHAQAKYASARRAKLDETPNLSRLDLVVLDDEDDLYDYLVRLGAKVPDRKTFRSEFRAAIESLK